ncbi:Flap endonuclease 1 [Mycena chlorophos]|uniref:Flap endonuclease 1 n=1 Tax=Mycena chlorophos TaxID=658473 RepID=A0A8H6TDP6_MYCCL|nr:Flap endonuclease 1 [Mycena chlorophos]
MSERKARSRENYAFFLQYRTRWSDNDQYQHVNNTTYYLWFDSIINTYLQEHCGQDPSSSPLIGLVISSWCEVGGQDCKDAATDWMGAFALQFFAPVSFPEVVDLGLRVVKLGSSSVSYEVGVFAAGKQTPAAVGGYTHVFVDRESRKSRAMESTTRDGLERLNVGQCLTGLLSEHAPDSIKEHDIKTLFGRKVAIDASMSIYQFLIAVRQKDGELLTNDAGETTSHLMGFFYRTIRIVENGIKPAYVFDGKPPELKKGVLSKRFEKREEAKEGGEEAKEVGTAEDVDKFSRRQVKVTREHNEECRRLLKLMGIPVIVAPSEAEAQCAELARGGKVYAAGSEDMDTLTFSAPILFRHLTFSEAKKQPISEINLKAALEGLDMDMSQFIDLCILLGCDYLEPIKGVGPKSALKLIREHGGLKGVVKHLRGKAAEKAAAEPSEDEEEEEPAPTSDLEKPSDDEDDEPKPKPKPKKKGKGKGKGGMTIPEEWPWEEAKKLFEKPDVTPADEVELEWNQPDLDGLLQFLVVEKGFNEDRVRKGVEKLTKFLNAKQQGRLDGFFTVKPKEKKEPAKKGKEPVKKGTKRKGDEKAESSSSKKAKTKK